MSITNSCLQRKQQTSAWFSLPFPPKNFPLFPFPWQLCSPLIRWIIKSAFFHRQNFSPLSSTHTECWLDSGRKSGLLVTETGGSGAVGEIERRTLSPPPPLFCTLCWSLNVLSNSITVGAMMFVRILYAFLNSSNLRVPIKTHAASIYGGAHQLSHSAWATPPPPHRMFRRSSPLYSAHAARPACKSQAEL